MSGRLSRRVEMTGEALMYAVSMSVLLTGMRWNREMVRPSMQGLLGWMLEVKRARRGPHGTGKAKGVGGQDDNGVPRSTVIEDKDALAAIERERGGM